MILVCAATRTEAGACAAAGVEVLRTGIGGERAARALAMRLARAPRPALVVSSGFAGALSGPLPLHGRVTATAVLRLEAGRAVPVSLAPGALRAVPGVTGCAVLSARAVTRADLSGLPPSTAVDMESAALAEVAAGAGIPFAVLRVITDTPEAPFPPLVGHLVGAWSAGPAATRLLAAARAASAGVRSPAAALRLVRSSLASRRALRDAWRSAPSWLAPACGTRQYG